METQNNFKIRKDTVDALLKQMVFNFNCADFYNMDKLELMIREINSIKKSYLTYL